MVIGTVLTLSACIIIFVLAYFMGYKRGFTACETTFVKMLKTKINISEDELQLSRDKVEKLKADKAKLEGSL